MWQYKIIFMSQNEVYKIDAENMCNLFPSMQKIVALKGYLCVVLHC